MDSLEQSKTKDVARDMAMAYTNDLVEVAVACQKHWKSASVDWAQLKNSCHMSSWPVQRK